MKKTLKIIGGIVGGLFAIIIILAIVDISNDDQTDPAKNAPQNAAENTEKTKEEIPEEQSKEETADAIGDDAVAALESNDFVKFADAYKELGNDKTSAWDNQLYGKKVTWTGTIVRAGTSQLFVYGRDDYNGETWDELGNNNKLSYAFTAKYADPAQFEGLKSGDTVTVEGTLESRGDFDLNYNWKIYDAVLK